MGSIDCIEMCPGDVGLRSWVASSTPNPDVGYLCTTSSSLNLIVGVRGVLGTAEPDAVAAVTVDIVRVLGECKIDEDARTEAPSTVVAVVKLKLGTGAS